MTSARLFQRPHIVGFALLVAALWTLTGVTAAAEEESDSDQTEPVSFYRQVRPIIQRVCSGCHQPAKQEGKLLLTSFAGLKKGGENGAGFETNSASSRTAEIVDMQK